MARATYVSVGVKCLLGNLLMRCIMLPPLRSTSKASFAVSSVVRDPRARKRLWARRDFFRKYQRENP